MTELKSVSAPAIGQEGLKRLQAFTRPSRMTSSSTLFDAGYEQAKRDFAEKLAAEAGRPVEIQASPENNELIRAALNAQRAFEKKRVRPWWHFL